MKAQPHKDPPHHVRVPEAVRAAVAKEGVDLSQLLSAIWDYVTHASDGEMAARIVKHKEVLAAVQRSRQTTAEGLKALEQAKQEYARIRAAYVATKAAGAAVEMVMRGRASLPAERS